MRNPFRRQTETAAPTLRERATALREGLSRRDAAPVERADLYGRLLAAYAEDRAARPISGRDGDETARRAADLVLNRTWALAREIVAMPPPQTLDGLRASALASAMLCEAECTTEDPTTVAAIGLTRAVLAVTGTPLPPGFVGFGDESDYKQRDRALFDAPGSLPAWAVAEIEAEDAADDDVQEAPPEAHSDLPAAILDGWAAWGAALDALGGDYSDEEADAAVAPMNRLVRSAAELPATPENITAKALAYAWGEWVSTERPGLPRDAYDLDGRLVYDLHTATMARGAQGDAATARRPAELPLSILVSTVDFAGATVRELWAIREAANLMCEVSNAKTWQGCNRLSDHPSGAARHNEVGKLMRWLSDAMCHVMSEAEKEARRRTPESGDDQKTRLAMLAVSVIDNDDLDETAAFARELLATVEA